MLGRRLRRLDWASGDTRSWAVPGFPTALVLRKRGGAAVALNDGVGLFDFDGEFIDLCRPEPGRPQQRINEGRCDPSGRFWVGTMTTNLTEHGDVFPIETRTGRLYCIDADGRARLSSDDIFGIPNTMIWTADGRFLVGDSMAGEIYAYDYDARTGAIVNRRVFVPPFARGVPDGSALDTEGFLWNARFGGGCVVRFDPSGAIDRIVELPAVCPTSCTFGGPDLDVLLVTTASVGLPAGASGNMEIQGAVLAIETGVRGVADNYFAG